MVQAKGALAQRDRGRAVMSCGLVAPGKWSPGVVGDLGSGWPHLDVGFDLVSGECGNTGTSQKVKQEDTGSGLHF